MNKAYVDFGTNVKVILMRDSTLVQYVTFDYSEDTLSYLYALLKEKSISELVYCIPSYFSKTLLADSSALSKETLALSSGYFCVSLKDLQKLEHLAESLKISSVHYTEHDALCTLDNGIYVMEYDNLYQVFVKVNAHLVEYDILTESLVEDAIQRYCLKYKLHDVIDYVNSYDLENLPATFDNVFSIDNDDVLCDLTYMAAIVKAPCVSADSYFNSEYRNQTLVSEDTADDFDLLEDTASPALRSDVTSAGMQQESDDNSKLKKSANSTNSAKDAKKKQKHDKLMKTSQQTEHKRSFMPVLAGALVVAIGLNAGMFYLRNSKQDTYNALYSDFTSKTSELNSLKSRYTMLSAMVTDESGKNAMQFINDTKLLKNKKIKLQSFLVEGSTVTVTVHAPDDNTFWKFHDSLSGKYEISNVSEGDNVSGSGVSYSVTLLL